MTENTGTEYYLFGPSHEKIFLRGWTLGQIAREAQVPYQRLLAITQGEEPTLREARQVAEVLDWELIFVVRSGRRARERDAKPEVYKEWLGMTRNEIKDKMTHD